MSSAAEHDAAQASVEARLDELQRQSQVRQAELRALAFDLPQATSRRAVLAAMWRSVIEAPDKAVVAKRAASRCVGLPPTSSGRSGADRA